MKNIFNLNREFNIFKFYKNPLTVWIVGYLLIILGFSFLFMLPQLEFYHGNITYEMEFKSLPKEISDAVTKRVSTSIFSAEAKEHIVIQQINAQTTINGFHYRYRYRFNPKSAFAINSRDYELFGGVFFCKIPFNQDIEHIQHKEYRLSCHPDLTEFPYTHAEEIRKNNQGDSLFYVNAQFNLNETDIMLNDLIFKYEHALLGSDSSNNLLNRFVRMFYFSTVTITTLGYGDISPINTLSRLAVTLESVIGLIYIGLFLNFLASKTKKYF